MATKLTELIRELRTTKDADLVLHARASLGAIRAHRDTDAALFLRLERAVRNAEYRVLGPGSGSLRDRVLAAASREEVAAVLKEAEQRNRCMLPKTFRRIQSAAAERLATLSRG